VHRREFLKSVAAATAVTMLGKKPGDALGAEAPPKINVLFVLADQWRDQAFSHRGDPNIKTTNFDSFADQGARWQRCYASNPLCTPNRSCLLTGRFSHQTGMIGNNLMIPPENRCLAEPFTEAGYATHYIGKWHVDGEAYPGFVPPGWRRRGFTTFEGFNRGHYYPTGAHYFTNDGKLIYPDVYEPTYQTDLAIDFMKKQKSAEKPFYCYLSWGPPHMPYKPPKEWDTHKPKELQWRPNVTKAEKARPATRRALAGYYGLIDSLDHEMGRLMKSLDDMGLADNTLVVFNSDHGDMHGSHGLHFKSKPEDESLHVPLMMRLPGKITPGLKPDALVSTIDLMPTILSLAGLKAPATVVGVDKSAAVLGGQIECDSVYSMGAMHAARAQETGAATPAHEPASEGAGESNGTGEWRCMVTPTHKLIVREGNVNNGLFDVIKDPYEMSNLWNKPESAGLQQQLLDRMKQWQTDTHDIFPAESLPAKKMYEKV
jgi:arylsulfatase A-like enzyme